MREVTDMLKKENQVVWTAEAKRSFQQIKDAISKAPILASPDCSREFHVFSFASEFTIAGVLLQENNEGSDQPIAFFSKVLRGAELKYNIMEKQAYAMI